MNSIKTYVEGKSLKVFFIIRYNGKRFQVYTGITSTVKFSGMIFPKSVPNARAKTAMLARLFASVEEYIYMNGELPAARMKDEIKAIINGRTASVEKNILYYIDEFIKTKAQYVLFCYSCDLFHLGYLNNSFKIWRYAKKVVYLQCQCKVRTFGRTSLRL